MEYNRLFLIVNPISGTSSKQELIPKIEEMLHDRGYDVHTQLTTGPGHATELALQAVSQGFDAVAVCGGDGTVNEAAKALCGTGVPMAILPSGSGNGLARHIGLAPDELSAIEIVSPSNIVDCDYGVVNGNKFFCAFGLGFDASVAQKFAEDSSRGMSTYVKNTFKEFSSYQASTYRITLDDQEPIERKAYVVACCNASQYGNNAFIAPNASITDGVFDVIILNDSSHLEMLIAGMDLLTGMLPLNRKVEVLHARSVKIVPMDESPAHIDGEPFPPQPSYSIEIVPGKLRLFASPNKKKFTPIITPLDYMTRDIGVAISRWINH